VRPDPRPLHGVVLAVHAFQPVAKLYESMTLGAHPFSSNPSFQKRFRDIIRMNRAGARTVLTNAQATPTGSGLLTEMASLDAELHAYEAAHWTEAPVVEPPPLPE
jgi:HEXXH motif-containing protein